MPPDIKQQAVAAIRNSYALLSEARDLSPANPKVTRTLTHLVRTLQRCQDPELAGSLLEAPALATEREHLPVACGCAECAMEKFWARRLVTQPVCDLTTFWYFDAYAALCHAELDLIRGRRFNRIAFLGSGGLPMTAVLLARHLPDTPIICIDYDREACALARRLIRRLGLHGRVRVRRMNALDHTPVSGELVICASLLSDGAGVYQRLAAHDCALLVRDAEGPYRYLYKPAELPCPLCFREVACTQLDARRINTSRYFVRVACCTCSFTPDEARPECL